MQILSISFVKFPFQINPCRGNWWAVRATCGTRKIPAWILGTRLLSNCISYIITTPISRIFRAKVRACVSVACSHHSRAVCGVFDYFVYFNLRARILMTIGTIFLPLSLRLPNVTKCYPCARILILVIFFKCDQASLKEVYTFVGPSVC